jgi:Fur family peroxide stress response transcriptional regulator
VNSWLRIIRIRALLRRVHGDLQRGDGERLLTELEQRCRELSVPLTVQRRAVLRALASRDDHPTADAIFTAVSKELPGISRATAYRTLDTLVAMGLVVRVAHDDSVARYDAKTWRHHHLACDRCGAMLDLESKALDAIELPDLSKLGFRARDFSVHVRGVCDACARPASRRSRRKT